MPDMDFYKSLIRKADTKMLLLVADGLGGLAREPGGKTELETANTPNLDKLAREGTCGLLDPVSPGITPGSGPAHLALFGYDPITCNVGRGLLSALGVGFPIAHGDVAARINFCTVDADGRVTDRRAGRISTEKNRGLIAKMRKIAVKGVEIFLDSEKEHRAVVIFRGEGLYDGLNDTDPQAVGVKPHDVKAADKKSEKTAKIVRDWLDKVARTLADEHPANMVLLRGFARHEAFVSMEALHGIRCGAIATYPMYKGVAKLVGTHVVECGQEPEDEVEALKKSFGDYDFFYVHYKKTDSRGEDGDFDAKVNEIEHFDALVAPIRELKFDVIAVTCDHSTPAVLKAHSWHPCPLILWSKYERADACERYSELECATKGGLGRLASATLLPLMLAAAMRLEKFGA